MKPMQIPPLRPCSGNGCRAFTSEGICSECIEIEENWTEAQAHALGLAVLEGPAARAAYVASVLREFRERKYAHAK